MFGKLFAIILGKGKKGILEDSMEQIDENQRTLVMFRKF